MVVLNIVFVPLAVVCLDSLADAVGHIGFVYDGVAYDLVVFIFGDQLHAKKHSEQVYAVYERGIVAVVFHFNNPSITFMPRLVMMA